MTQTVIVTGAGGYIGATLVDKLLRSGRRVIGIDRYFFDRGVLGETLDHPHFTPVRKDTRDLDEQDLAGADAVFDLAALSNDPAGALDHELTYAINHQARARTATLAKKVGVKRYVLASSCSVYGAGGDDVLTEESSPRPVSAYACANLQAEQDVLPLCSSDFAVTVLRQATVFGLAKRMRFDLVVNLMTLNAVRDRKIFVLGGGRQWRPVVHVEDVATALACVLDHPLSTVNGQIFNAGSSEQNYQILGLAYIVRENLPFPIELEVVPDDSDARNYHVSFEKVKRELGFKPEYGPAHGTREIYEALKAGRVDTGIKTVTVRWYEHLLDAKRLVDELGLNGRLL